MTSTDSTSTENPAMPTPHPALRELDRFVGHWRMSGHLVGSDEEIVRGEAEYSWLPGGFFLQQKISLQFGPMAIESTELVGYDAEHGVYPSQVFSNMSPVALPYTWAIDGDEVRITVVYEPLDATFTGRFTPDGRFAGGWRPNPGADTSVNVPYDISGTRVA